MRRLRLRAPCGVALLLLAAAADAGSAPTLWRARRADGSEALHLLGALHYGRDALLEFPPAVERAFARCDELVLEVDPEQLDPEVTQELALRLARIEPPASLRDRVSADTLAELSRYFELGGESLRPYLAFEPWWVYQQLQGHEFERIGLDPARGVDLYFAERAAGRLPVVGLETAESQLRLLAGLPLAVQELLILDTLLRSADPDSGVTGLVRAWRRGDDAALERILYEPLEQTPELAVFYDRLVFGRNEAMALRLASLSRDGKRRFVVIGAGHLVGPRGVPALLRDYGLRVDKLEVRP